MERIDCYLKRSREIRAAALHATNGQRHILELMAEAWERLARERLARLQEEAGAHESDCELSSNPPAHSDCEDTSQNYLARVLAASSRR
jgi:hypothetical protein